MPFQEKSLDEVPEGTPNVQIFFHGQLLLRASEDGTICEVAVNPLAVNHVLTIETRTKEPGRPDTIRMRQVGPLLLRHQENMLREGMTITILGDGPAPAAFKCMEIDVPIDYTSGGSIPADEDFRWILNLEGPYFHKRALEVPAFNSQHVIKLQGGEYFFRTAVRAGVRLGHQRTGGGENPQTFRKIGVIASASVFLDDGQSVMLAWQASTREGDFTVILDKRDDITHEIYINNAPLFLDEPPDDPNELAKFDELPEYYKLIRNVTEAWRFHLAPTKLDDISGQGGSPDIPCQVLRLDGPTND